MTRAASLLPALAAAVLLGGCVLLPRQEPLPAGTLDAEGLHRLFVGRTAVSVTASKGRESVSYYDPGGQIRQLREGERRTGTWRITDSARICLKMEQGAESCRIVALDKGTYRKYVVKASGPHEPVVEYTSFADGNPRGL